MQHPTPPPPMGANPPAPGQAPATKTSNPIVAIGHKVKSALTPHQQPSVRIYREPEPEPEPQEQLPFLTRISSKLSRSSPNRTPGANDQSEYDSDTVDLLDVVGACLIPPIRFISFSFLSVLFSSKFYFFPQNPQISQGI